MKIRVSVVDDEDGIRASLKVVLGLSDEFETVGSHPDAREALVQLPKENPQVVLMDIRLPGMSGIECTQRLKALMPEVKVIMLTSMTDDRTVFSALCAGADGFLYKSNLLQDCHKAIRDVLAGGSPISAQAARVLIEAVQRIQGSPSAEDFLTHREQELLELLARGWTDKEISAALNIGLGTVHTHLQHIYRKLDVHSRGQAIALFLKGQGGPGEGRHPLRAGSEA